MLDFRAFEIVLAIVQTGSLSAAAARLAMQQPALTKTLASIEADIGAKLFLRTATGMQPTRSAEIFVRNWEGIYRDLVDMRQEIDRIHGVDGGVLRIATGYLAASSVEMAIGAMKMKFPSLLIEARQAAWSEVASAVRRGEVDIGISDPSDAESEPGLSVQLLSERDAHFVCRSGHPLLAMNAPEIEDILSYPLAISLIPAHMAQYLPKDFEARGFRRIPQGHILPPIAIQSMSAISNILITSDAVSILPKQNFADLFRSGRLARIESFTPPWLKVRLGFITRTQSVQTPALTAFIEEVQRLEREEIRDEDGE